jgi:hypothetical protein
MSQFPIFKVHQLTNRNKTATIFVFIGDDFSDKMGADELTELFVESPQDKIFTRVFDRAEIATISRQQIDVVFINMPIHIDDSIGIIKLKIFEAIRKEASMSEIYLFCLKNEKLNPITVYQNLTQNDKLPLTRIRMNQLLLNLYDTDGTPINFKLDEKDIYTFDNILQLDLVKRDYLVSNPLGQKIVFVNEYPIVADPFLIDEFDVLLERSRRELSTLNANLLLDSGPIFKNTIYLCLADDVFKHAEAHNNDKYISKIYYPFLYQAEIETLEQLESKRTQLIRETDARLTSDVQRNMGNIDMFYQVFRDKSKSAAFTENTRLTGITYLKVVRYPEFNIKIPIDVIFKLIHATDGFPLIKYNSDTRQENIYRLFAPQMTADGRKIPFLAKAAIFKLMKTIGKSKSVAVYTTATYNGQQLPIACEFEESGIITVYPLVDFTSPIMLTEGDNMFTNLDVIIQSAINPLIEQIKPFFAQSGLDIPIFDSIQSVNVEVRDMKFQTNYGITKAFDINKYRGCISSIFILESTNFKKGLQMRYKRVSNFNKRDSQEAFIIEKIDQGLKIDEIIEELTKQYSELTDEAATDLIAKIRSELEVTRGVNKRRALAIKINPGFFTETNMNFIKSELTITVSGINNIYYLSTIPVYLESFIRITQDVDNAGVSSKIIKKKCSEGEVEDIEFGQITAQSEKTMDENVVPIFNNETPTYSENNDAQSENMDELLDLLGLEEDEDEEFGGGGGNSSDSSQVESPQVSSSSVESPQVSSSSPSPQPSPSLETAPAKIKNDNISLSDLEAVEERSLVEEPSPIEERSVIAEPSAHQSLRDVIDMKLKYPNPFSARLEERVPQLFVKSKDEKFDLYTRMCPFSVSDRRQPVILTQEEKERIIQQHPNDVNPDADFIEYNADPNDASKKYYYTCPRYWCLLTDTMVTEQDILDGKCGPKVAKVEDAIIPKKADVVPPGKYVYKFYDENEKKYPGFHKQKMPSGLCIPCCYSNWATTEMKNRRDICQGKFDEKSAEAVSETEKAVEAVLKRNVMETEQYVKGPEKYGPQLGEFRWGFLPISVQYFLHEVNEDCQISKTNTNLKLNHTCLLRLGVENSANQSFIACIASAIFYGQKDERTKKPLITKFIPNARYEVPTIKEMKQIIIQSIDLDRFVKYQNGDLIASFSDSTNKKVDTPINFDAYSHSKLYQKLKKEGDSNTGNDFFQNVVRSFENFKAFLSDDTIRIDYTYLWDLICYPNPNLFAAGLNMIILEIPEDDPTNNINLVCPTNHYSAHIYDARKRSLLLVKRDNYFEPIYGHRNDGKKINITKTFSEYDKNLPKTLRTVFNKIIKPTLGEKCRALVSRPNEYRFKQSPILDNLITELVSNGYSVTVQILNFGGKVIGVLAKNREGLEGFIPCFPSALTNLKRKTKTCNGDDSNDLPECQYDFVYMNDDIWKPYEYTLEFLKEYYDYEDPVDERSANCFNPKYFCRVVEDELITGFLTNTNQFVPIKDPIPVSSVDDNIKTVNSNNMLVADINTLTNSRVDSKRVDFIKRIQLETSFYNVFRNTIRILFNDYSNSSKRKTIQDECNKRYVLYRNQLDTVVGLLHTLVDDHIIFASKDDFNYLDVDENDIYTCITKSADNCNNDNNSSVCRMTNGKCTLVLPKHNLVNDTNNEEYYYGRMADELIRYNRIKSFIFKPQSYLSFGTVKYNLRHDEIIILQDLLNQDFFENLVAADINRFAKYNTFDTAEPIITQKYNNETQFDELIHPTFEHTCNKSAPQSIKSRFWQKCFPNTFKEIEYTGSPFCSLQMAADIINVIQGTILTIQELKTQLINQYNILTSNFTDESRIHQILNIFKEEAQFDITPLQNRTTNFERLINSDTFIAVNFDLWLLFAYYKTPVIFISSKLIPETRYNYNEFVCYMNTTDSQSFVFVVTPPMYKRPGNIFPTYKYIVNNDGGLNINLNLLKAENCRAQLNAAFENYVSIPAYLDVIFVKDVTTKYVPKQKKMRNIVFDVVEDVDNGENIEPIVKVKKMVKAKANANAKTKTKANPRAKKIISTIILEEEPNHEETEFKIENILKPNEEIFEIIPSATKKTAKQRVRNISVNPVGKSKTRKTQKATNILEAK